MFANAKRNAKLCFAYKSPNIIQGFAPYPTKGFPPLETDKEMIPLTPICLRRTLPVILRSVARKNLYKQMATTMSAINEKKRRSLSCVFLYQQSIQLLLRNNCEEAQVLIANIFQTMFASLRTVMTIPCKQFLFDAVANRDSLPR